MVPPTGPFQHRSTTGETPLLKFGPFKRNSSHGSIRSVSPTGHSPREPDGSHACTELGDDDGSGVDEPGKLEADMAKSKAALAAASASDREEKKAAAAEKRKAATAARKEAASIAKRPAAASIAKRPAAACGKLDIEVWARDNLDENEAAEEPVRRYYVSNLTTDHKKKAMD